ncbi:MAG TPA: serine hydrolase domain-containing protein [Gammaproteobacteria bacterium]|nr:serine hydrolase domain-containing protein [Gammaproteobacteria bacterium]
MKKLIIMLVIILEMAISVTHASNRIHKTYLSAFEQNLIANMQKQIPVLLKQYNTPGAVVAIIDKNGIIWAEGFGVTDMENSNPITPDTLFSLQSQSKLFTALGILRAVQQNQVSLNKPVSFYLPDLKAYSAFEKNPTEKMTLINLLSHTAGFAHDAPVGNNNNANPDFDVHIKSIIDGTWLQFPVGKGYQYSNVGIDLAGYILQKQYRLPFNEVMEKIVFLPLEMRNSTFNLEIFLNSPNHATGHIDGLTPIPYNHSFIPSGGMYSNVIDLSHYVEFQLNNGAYHQKTILKKDLLKTLLSIPYSNQNQTSGYAQGVWKGKRLNTLYFAHLGRGFGFANDLEWYPEYQIGVIVLTNKADNNNTDIKIAHLIIDPVIKHMQEHQLSDLIKMITGSYISDSTSINIIKNDNRLFIEGELNTDTAGNIFEKINDELSYIGNSTFHAKSSNIDFYYIKKSETGTPAIQQIGTDKRWYLNKPDFLSEGPNRVNWKKYTGTYELQSYGAPIQIIISIKQGYLYINDLKLQEMKPGVFATANGQMLVFHDENHASWCNLFIKKSNHIQAEKM